MPYCPKCDMEFIEGVQICSDCKGPLLASRKEAQILQKEQEERALKEYLSHIREAGFSMENETITDEAAEDDFPDEKDLQHGSSATANPPGQQLKPTPSVYVKKSDRYQDMQSSASAFLLIGGIAILISALIFAGIIPIAGSSKLSFGGVLGVMGIACMVVFVKTKKEAAGLKAEAEAENKKTQELIAWFLETHSAEDLENKLSEESGGNKDCTPEELSLKRFSLIQDYLAVEQDLPDQSYIDALSEEIYSRMFE